jgi:hypothetical protein
LRGIARVGNDVADGGDAAVLELAESVTSCAGEIGRCSGAFENDHLAQPFGERAGWGNFASEMGVIEMAMGVDESWQQNDFAEVANFSSGQGMKFSDGGDASSANFDDGVFDGRFARFPKEIFCAQEHLGWRTSVEHTPPVL